MIEEIILKMIDARVEPLERRIGDLERERDQAKGLLAKPTFRMREAEKILGRNRFQITVMIHNGTIKKARKIGRPWYFDAEELRQIAGTLK